MDSMLLKNPIASEYFFFLQHLKGVLTKCRSVVLICTTSQYSDPRKTFANRCGNNSPTHMRGNHYTFSCLLFEVS